LNNRAGAAVVENVIASEAKQSSGQHTHLDRFVAALLAMTRRTANRTGSVLHGAPHTSPLNGKRRYAPLYTKRLIFLVMPALVAGLHVFKKALQEQGVDGREKPGHDDLVSRH
jgi:hypothetical protein